MTLLAIAKGLARNVGMKEPSQVIGSAMREWQEALQFANETGEELARRVDWGDLHKTVTLTGTGADISYSMPTDFSRVSQGVAVLTSGGAIIRPQTRPEWNTLTPVQGTPRYFLLEGETMRLWPYLANAATVTVHYQSRNWTGTGSAFTADDQSPVMSEDLFLKGLIVRWRLQKGMPYSDEEAQYEAALTDYARFDQRSRF